MPKPMSCTARGPVDDEVLCTPEAQAPAAAAAMANTLNSFCKARQKCISSPSSRAHLTSIVRAAIFAQDKRTRSNELNSSVHPPTSNVGKQLVPQPLLKRVRERASNRGCARRRTHRRSRARGWGAR
eukprot:6197427-Pleurochrysis_carterae.AAC.3